jgi:chitinase
MVTDYTVRCVALLAVVLVLAGCGGGGGGGGASSLRVEVSPTSQLLEVDTQHSFSAQVVGNANLRVNWSVQEVNGGVAVQTSDTTATYTAPGQPGTYHVVATSQADNTKTAVAEVRVYTLPPSPP